MQQTIKDQIQTQIYLNEQLLHYDDSDSQESVIQQQNKFREQIEQRDFKYNDNDRRIMCNFEELNEQNDKNMSLKRRRFLNQLLIQSKQNVNLNQKHQTYYSLKSRKQNIHEKNHKQNYKYNSKPNQESSSTVLELKSKLAQVLKQSKKMEVQIQQFYKKQQVLAARLLNLEAILQQKQTIIHQKDQQILKLKYHQQKLKIQYQQRITTIQDQLHLKNQNEYQQLAKNQSKIDIKQQKLEQMRNLLELKNQQLQTLKRKQKNYKKCFKQNQKLKIDIQRLLQILQNYEKQSTLFNKSHKSQKQERHSLSKSNKYKHKSIVFSQTIQGSKIIDLHNLSLPSKRNQCFLEWYPTNLINQVECFLKKWHMGYNNDKFVHNLVQFVNNYTQKCVRQNKGRMQNQYKSLKKQIQRKANQSLTIQQIMRQRQLRKKHLQTKENLKDFCKSQIKNQNQQCSSQNISVLVPASNKANSKSQKHQNLNLSQLRLKLSKKDNMEYQILQKSIRVHHKNSLKQFKRSQNQKGNLENKINLNSVNKKYSKKSNGSKYMNKNYKTQASIQKQNISQIKIKNKKSMNKKNVFSISMGKYKIF